MNRFARVAAATGVAGFVLFAGVADAKLARFGNSAQAKFHGSVKPAGLKIDGATNDVQVSDDGTNVKISVGLATLDTGLALRNEHMRDKYLEVKTYPNAEFTVARSALHFPAAGATQTGDAPGTMKIHGKEKAVTVHYTAQRNGEAYVVTGTASLNISDYGIVIPSYMGVTLKENVDVEVAFAVTDK